MIRRGRRGGALERQLDPAKHPTLRTELIDAELVHPRGNGLCGLERPLARRVDRYVADGSIVDIEPDDAVRRCRTGKADATALVVIDRVQPELARPGSGQHARRCGIARQQHRDGCGRDLGGRRHQQENAVGSGHCGTVRNSGGQRQLAAARRQRGIGDQHELALRIRPHLAQHMVAIANRDLGPPRRPPGDDGLAPGSDPNDIEARPTRRCSARRRRTRRCKTLLVAPPTPVSAPAPLPRARTDTSQPRQPHRAAARR